MNSVRPYDNWEKILKEAEKVLSDNKTSIDVLIRAIKQINPTPHVHLSPEEKENAYKLKSDLQNHLLIHHGELFDLEPTQWDENIVLIRYKPSPLLDACHAKLHLLSENALAQIRKGDVAIVRHHHRKEIKVKTPKSVDTGTLHGIVEQARLYMENYEYDSARELLASMVIESKEEVLTFLRGVSILTEELGVYDLALDLLFSLPKELQNDDIREITANACWHNGQYADARGLFEECVIKELKKESIVRYANILHREGESRSALDLLNQVEGMSGFIEGMDALKVGIYRALAEEAQPHLDAAKREFDANNFDLAEEAAGKAIAIFPECVEAKELLKMMKEIRNEDNVKSLWQRFSATTNRTERLNILKNLKSVDTHRLKKIETLIEREMEEEKQEGLERLVCEIKGHLEKNEYDNAFDKIFPLLKNRNHSEPLKLLVQEYSQIQCIVSNAQFLRLKPQEAKECWLSYLQLRDVSIEHNADKAASLLRKARKAFHAYPAYMVMEQQIHEITAKQSRERISGYLSQLEGNDVSLDKAEKIVSLMKKESKNLPLEEADRLSALYEPRLKELQLKNGESYHLNLLKKSLLLGDIESALIHKQSISDPIAIKQVEDDVAEYLHDIESKPVAFELSTDLYSAFKTRPDKGIKFLNCIEEEAFFRYSISDTNFLIIVNLKTSECRRYDMKDLSNNTDKVFHADVDTGEYGLLCTSNLYIRVVLNKHKSSVLAYINLCELLYVDVDNFEILDLFYLNDHRHLCILYRPGDDEHWERRIAYIVDVFKGTMVRQKDTECHEHCFAKSPTNPSSLLMGDTELALYDDRLRKIKRIAMDEDWEWYEEIDVDRDNERIYIVMEKGRDNESRGQAALVVLDFDLNIIESHEDIWPKYNFLSWKKYYDPERGLIYIEGHEEAIVYDLKNRGIIKNIKAQNWFFDRKMGKIYMYDYLPVENKVVLTDISSTIDVATRKRDGSGREK